MCHRSSAAPRDDRIDTFNVAPLQIQCLAADVQRKRRIVTAAWASVPTALALAEYGAPLSPDLPNGHRSTRERCSDELSIDPLVR